MKTLITRNTFCDYVDYLDELLYDSLITLADKYKALGYNVDSTISNADKDEIEQDISAKQYGSHDKVQIEDGKLYKDFIADQSEDTTNKIITIQAKEYATYVNWLDSEIDSGSITPAMKYSSLTFDPKNKDDMDEIEDHINDIIFDNTVKQIKNNALYQEFKTIKK